MLQRGVFDMIEIIFKAFCIATVVFCIVTIAKKFIFTSNKTKLFNQHCFIILKMKDCHEQIEGIIRSIIWESLNITNGGFIPNILIVDDGISENTLQIIKKLMKDYNFIYYITNENFNKIKEKIRG